MTNTEIAIIDLIRSSLFGQSVTFADDVDWDEVLAEAQAQTIVALVHNAVPKEKKAAWKLSAMQSTAHFLRALYEQTEIVSILKDAKIPFVIIKGTSAAIYYPNPSTRTMGDVDILVTEEHFDKAFSLLQDNGYIFQQDYGNKRDYSFTKGNVIFELHRKYSDDSHDIERFLKDGIQDPETLSLFGNSFPALPKAENGLIILDHIRHHIYGGLGIRQIIDFMMFVNSEPDDVKFEKEILPLFEKAGLKTLAQVIIKTCKKYFHLPVNAAWCETADDKTCDELLATVFASGNFGRKNPYVYRPMQTLTMTVKKQGFFRTLQNAGVENCAAFKKHKFLRPFAWLYQLFRYFKRGIVRLFKREKLLADISSGKEKNDFYKRLGI